MALLPGVGATGGAPRHHGGAARPLSTLLLVPPAHRRPRATPVVLVVFDDDIAQTHFLRVAQGEMDRLRTAVPLLASHRELVEREGPLGRAWLASGGDFEPVRPLTNAQGERQP